MAKHTWLAAILTCTVWIPIEALAQGAPPDIVELENGGMIRGTIVESIPGDHVTIQLVTGETRTIPAAEVRYAGPTRAAVETTPVPPPSYEPTGPAPAAPSGPRTVRVHVEGAPGLTLQRVTGTGSAIVSSGYGVAAISIDTFAPVCTAPCDVDLEVATYRFGVSAGQGNAQLAGNNTFSLDRDTTLRLEHEDRTGLRILGWGLFIGGALGGMLGALAPMFATRSDEGVPFLVLGSALGGSMMIAGFVLIFLRDHVDIHEGAIRF